LPDEAGALIRPVIAAWKARRPSVSGHEGSYGMREIANAAAKASTSTTVTTTP
jgi:hypothetical protein